MEVLEKRKKNITKSNQDLGLANLERAEIVTALNQLLANYEVHYQKLRNFHWNVTGPDFFDLHDKFEEFYNDAHTKIDSIAERIRTFDHRPYSTYQEYLSHSTIDEINKEITAVEMVNEVIRDFEILIRDMTQAVSIAQESGDIGTEDMMISFIKDLEKNHWMLKAFNNHE